MKLGDDDETPVIGPRADLERHAREKVAGDVAREIDEASDGEVLYTVLVAAVGQASEAQRVQIALALNDQRPWSALSGEVRELFEMAGEALFEDEDDDQDDDGDVDGG